MIIVNYFVLVMNITKNKTIKTSEFHIHEYMYIQSIALSVRQSHVVFFCLFCIFLSFLFDFSEARTSDIVSVQDILVTQTAYKLLCTCKMGIEKNKTLLSK